jgi:tetratricopeptide (TPR) repeat protein
VVRAWAQVGLAQLALAHGAGPDELGAARAALATFTAVADVPGQLSAHTQLAALEMTIRAYDRARWHGAAALELARRSGGIRDVAVAENNLTWHEIREGDLAAARRRLAEADRLSSRCGEHRLRAVAVANLAEVERLDGRYDEAARLGRDAIAELEDVGDPGHRRRVLATVALALAEGGRAEEADLVLAELRPPGNGAAADGQVLVIEGAIALRRGDEERAAGCFAAALDAFGPGHDPRDTVEALVGLVRSAPDPDRWRTAVSRLRELCRTGGISLLPRERDLLGARAMAEIESGD